MADAFEIQRQRDQASGDMVDEAMGRLEESRELGREHRERLQPLDESHYFDPGERKVLRRVLDRYNTVADGLDSTRHSVENAERALSGHSFKSIGNGLYWNPGERSLFVKSNDHYVLYARDRRRRPGAVEPGTAPDLAGLA